MSRDLKPPGPIAGYLAGRRAALIPDPVERLRFLRHAIGDRRPWAQFDPAPWWRTRRAGYALGLLLVLIPAGRIADAGRFWRRDPPPPRPPAGSVMPRVWQVQQTPEFETWSNGLRVERRFETAGEPRQFQAFRLGAEDSSSPVDFAAPAGIVYHTTESVQEAFEEQNNSRLTYLGEALLRFLRNSHSYHYLVDRFGRVWRVVRDSDAAWHAGHSVWAGSAYTYVNLNHGFLGVAVEAQTGSAEGRPRATPAQIRSLEILTEMLRARFGIPGENCVTHAQVSVNPDNFRIGYHTDWAAHFPFADLGLPDNYSRPSPAIVRFGFRYDPTLVNVTGEPYWKSLVLGEELLRQDATAHGLTAGEWRSRLAERYRQVVRAMKARTESSKEKEG